MKNIFDTYNNLNVFITEETELENFRSLYDVAKKDTSIDQIELLARIMYAYGKKIGTEQQQSNRG